MGCGGDREKGPPEHTARWEFITLADFKSSKVLTRLAYGWLWFMALVGVAVYAVDTFTAVNLLVFNNWSSQVQPSLPFEYSKWIFSICILVSWALCIVEWIRAIRVIRRGGVAESYMDPLAVRLQSMRSQGWKRFLVFTELTNSKKRIDYVALFVYFAFKGAIRVVLAEGPRQVVNGLTLYSVMQAKLIVKGTPTDHRSSIDQFFLNIQALAEQNDRQAAILFSMLFTFVIWVFSALSLIAATILYLLFLWHYVPQRDGRLSIYCRRKIDKRLEKIVEHKIKAAIEEENQKREKAERKAQLKKLKTGETLPLTRPTLSKQPTLPNILDADLNDSANAPDVYLPRNPSYISISSRPSQCSGPPTTPGGVQRQPTLPNISEVDCRPDRPRRMDTHDSQRSAVSFGSDAPLIPNAGYAGIDAHMKTPAPTYYSRQSSSASVRSAVPLRNQRMSPSTPRVDSQSLRDHYPQKPLPHRPSFGSSRFQTSSAPPLEQGREQGRLPKIDTGFGLEEPKSAAGIFASPQEMYAQQNFSLSNEEMRHGRNDSYTSVLGRSYPQTESSAVPTLETSVTQMHRSLQSSQGSISQSVASFTVNRQDQRPSAFGTQQIYQSSTTRIPIRKPVAPNVIRGDYLPAPTPNVYSQEGSNHVSNSFELTAQPPYSSGPLYQAPRSNSVAKGGYVAFRPNPSNVSSRATDSHPGPQRNLTVTGPPGEAGNYFGLVEDNRYERSATAPNAGRRLSAEYNDILDEYCGAAPDEHD